MITRSDAATPRPPLTYRMTRAHWVAIDCAVAVVAAGILVFNVHGVGLLHEIRYQLPTAVTGPLALAATLPVAVRRLWPIPVLAVVTVGCCVLTALGRGPVTVDWTLCMAIYTAAVSLRRPAAIAALVATELALGASVLTAAADSKSQADAVHSLLAAGALWFIGDSVRERRKYLAGLAEQAEQRRQAEDQRGRLAVREERIRIARELHDVVAHSLSVVTVQAGVGRRVGAAHPVEALRALRAVELTGRGALAELRRILGLLRDDDAEEVSLAPAPGICDLARLADTVREAGVPARLAVTGDTVALPPAVGLTVYRIVQEALTNVVKHAPGAEADVRVHAGPDGVRITVADSGPPGGPSSVGPSVGPSVGRAVAAGDHHGIVGMRERAAAFGGTLKAGPRPGGGYQVAAFIPAPAQATGQVA
jgi:signal transduction histidine kinase